MNDINQLTNQDLMERVKNCSDQEAFQVLYNRIWDKMYVRAFSILGNRSDAKDIIQEVWINFWERRDKIENNNIEGYLFNALRFKIYNEFRNSKTRNKLVEEFIKYHISVKATNNIDNVINLNDTKKIIESSINKLSSKCKEVFVLSRYEGLKNNEIAQKLDISQRTVETHISNAINKIRRISSLGLIFLISIV